MEGIWGSDILFFGDTSGSMTEELETLGEKVAEFVAGLYEFTDDWQLLAVTGPDGCGVNGVLTPQTQGYEELFAQAIITPPGQDEVDEWGLYNVAAAIELTGEGDCNEGFLRDDAMLHVVFISDEDDNSPGWEEGGDYWRGYVDEVLAAKSYEESVAFSAVAGPVPKGCGGAEPGWGYAEAVEDTEGEFLSICDAWYEQLEVLVGVSLRRSIFELEQIPVVDTIEVKVNQVLREDWTYNEGKNAVVFSSDAPQGGDEVNISYDPLTDSADP